MKSENMSEKDLSENYNEQILIKVESQNDSLAHSRGIIKTNNYNKLAFLYLLRFILAFSIILWHFSFGISETNRFLYYIRVITIYGGNQAFLLISGMMFYLAYYPKLESGKMKITDFLKKRAIRIYPITIVSVLVSYLLSVIIHFSYNAGECINLILLIEDMFFFGSRLFGGAYGIYNGPIWFLSVLLVAYLLSVFIIFITRKKKSVYWFLIPLFITFFVALGSNFIVPIFNVQSIAAELFNFFLGIFFMLFLTNFDKWSNYLKIPLRIICLTISILFLVAFYKSKANSPLGNGELIGSLFCWIPLIISLYGLKINIVFDNIVFKTLGALSFHLYVWHAVVYKMWQVYFSLANKPIWTGDLFSLLTYLSLVFAVSAISYTVCELMRKYRVVDKIKTKINKINNNSV